MFSGAAFASSHPTPSKIVNNGRNVSITNLILLAFVFPFRMRESRCSCSRSVLKGLCSRADRKFFLRCDLEGEAAVDSV